MYFFEFGSERVNTKQSVDPKEEKTRRRWFAAYLDSLVFAIRSEKHAVLAVGQGVALDPLIGILSALRCDPSKSGDLTQVDLQPLFPVVATSTPRPAVVNPSMPGRKVVVVVGRRRHVSILNSFIFHTKRDIAASFRSKKKITLLMQSEQCRIVTEMLDLKVVLS